MSFNGTTNEPHQKYCSVCQAGSADEHVCSSQLLSDSMHTLAELASEQLNALETFSLTSVHVKCQDELDSWHSAAIAHLAQIFAQRSTDLENIYSKELCPDFETHRSKMIEELNTRVRPKLVPMLTDPSVNGKRAQRIQHLLSEMASDCSTIDDRQWLHVQLPDLKHFSVPIRIAKMALAARLTNEGDKDPFDELSDDEGNQQSNNQPTCTTTTSTTVAKKKKKANTRDVIDVLASNPVASKTHLLESNSSTLALSSGHLLLHDNKRLVLFDLKKKVHEMEWNDNDHGVFSVVDRRMMNKFSSRNSR